MLDVIILKGVYGTFPNTTCTVFIHVL